MLTYRKALVFPRTLSPISDSNVSGILSLGELASLNLLAGLIMDLDF
jgi:hypothetical protein